MPRPLPILLSLLLTLSLACSDDTEPVAGDKGVTKDMSTADKAVGVDKGSVKDAVDNWDKSAPPDKKVAQTDKSQPPDASAAAFTLTSTAFVDKAAIPKKHSCEGTDVSPALKWSGAPAGTKAFALIVDDPDAPGGTFIHWVAYDLEPTLTGLAEGVAKTATVTGVGNQGITGFGKVGYYGPCPPSGSPHNYKFMLHALSKKLGLMAGATSAQVQSAVASASLKMTTLTGTYKR